MSYTPPVGNATVSKPGLVQLAGDLGGTATAPTVPGAAKANGGGQETLVTNSTVTGSYTVNLANGNVFSLTLTGNTTLAFSGAVAGKACSFSLYIKQDATGSRTITWPSGIKWSGGAPSLTTTANALDIFVLESLDGGTTWYASLVGSNFV